MAFHYYFSLETAISRAFVSRVVKLRPRLLALNRCSSSCGISVSDCREQFPIETSRCDSCRLLVRRYNLQRCNVGAAANADVILSEDSNKVASFLGYGMPDTNTLCRKCLDRLSGVGDDRPLCGQRPVLVALELIWSVCLRRKEH